MLLNFKINIINPLSSPDRVHTPRYVTTLPWGVGSVRRTQRVNKRIETSFGKNNNSNTHTHIISQRNTTKKFSHANIQSSSNFSSKNNTINNSRRKFIP